MQDRFVDITEFMNWVDELKRTLPQVFELLFDSIIKELGGMK